MRLATLSLWLLPLPETLCADLGSLPPMGWSSWNVFAGGIDEGNIKQTMDAMASLREFGYTYVNIDDNWQLPERSAEGLLQWSPEKFPAGMPALADHAHSLGLKFGIYTARGHTTCMGRPGSRGHYELDAETFAGWGVDYLKVDSCDSDGPNTSMWEEFAALRAVLDRQARPIYYSICPGASLLPGMSDVAWHSPSRCGADWAYHALSYRQQGVQDPKKVAHSILIEWDNDFNRFFGGGYGPGPGRNGIGNCGGWVTNLDAAQDLVEPFISGPGHWVDLDMLVVGCNNATTNGSRGTPCQGHQTLIEQRAQFAMWCMAASPLILGNDIRYLDPEIRAIITDRDLIALNQDPLGHRADILRQTSGTRAQQVYRKLLQDKASPAAIALFNRGNVTVSMAVERSDIGPETDECRCVALRDLETKQVVAKGCKPGTVYETQVLAHQAVVLRVLCARAEKEPREEPREELVV